MSRFSIKDMSAPLREHAAAAWPEFRRICDRVYDLPGNAGAYTTLLNCMALGLTRQDHTSTHNLTCAAAVSALYGFPWWYVSKPMLETLLHITPPEDLPVDEVRFKFPSMYFLLPRGVLIGDEGEDIHVVNVTLLNEEVREKARVKYGKDSAPAPSDRVLMQGTAMAADGALFHSSVPVENGLIRSSTMDTLPLQVDYGLKKDTTWASKVLMPLLINIVTLMAANPELVEADGLRKRIKGGKESWNPRRLGRNHRYKVSHGVSEPGDPTGRRMPMHWRAGHWRGVWFGKDRKQHKLVLIDPVLVNPEPGYE